MTTRREHETRRAILAKLEKRIYSSAAWAADQVDRGSANLGGEKLKYYEKARRLLYQSHRMCVKILRCLKR